MCAVVSTPVPRRDSASYGLALLRGLLASLPAAVAYLAGPDLIIEFANEYYRELVGDRDLVGRPLREAVPEARLELLERILRTGEAARGTESEAWVNRGGKREQIFVDYVYQPVRNSDGSVAGVLLYAADVTAHVQDRRRLQALSSALAASEERYRTLFQTMPQGVLHFSADGAVVDANPAVLAMLGLDPAEMTTWPLRTSQQAVREDGSPFPPDELPIPTALRTGQIVTGVMGVPHGRTGELRWLQVTAVPDTLSAGGRPQRAYGLVTDLTEQRRTEAVLQESTALLGTLRDANVLGVMVSTEEGIQEANDALLDIVGYSREEVTAGRMSYRDLAAPEWEGTDREAVAELHRTGAVKPYAKEYLRRDGRRVPVLVGAAVVDRHPFRWVTFVLDLSARARAEQERTELQVRERAARAEADQAQERLSFLQRAGALVAATSDRQLLLEQMTRLVVPSMADYCAILEPASGGKLQAAATTHRDPRYDAVLGQLREQQVSITGPMMTQLAYSTGKTQLVDDASAQIASWAQSEPLIADALREVSPQSALAVPLTAAQERLGVLILSRGGERGAFTSSDVAVMEELGRRLAAGLANADAFAREHKIAETLQRSLLPAALPEVPGLDLAVRYLPATDGADVGGDWYDAFGLGANRVGLVIGDVVGHSIHSASVMGQIRGLLRAYALHQPIPSVVLQRTSIAVDKLLPAALATVACAVLDVITGELTYASAGHPPPLFIGADGDTAFLDEASGVMLGAAADARFVAGQRYLAPGAAVLFYTDGLIEGRHRDIGEGFGALARALAGPASRTADQICAAAQEALLDTAPRADDVCLLAVRRLRLGP